MVLYGWHPVAEALRNPDRAVHRLLATENFGPPRRMPGRGAPRFFAIASSAVARLKGRRSFKTDRAVHRLLATENGAARLAEEIGELRVTPEIVRHPALVDLTGVVGPFRTAPAHARPRRSPFLRHRLGAPPARDRERRRAPR
jgi:hypothetical protein